MDERIIKVRLISPTTYLQDAFWRWNL